MTEVDKYVLLKINIKCDSQVLKSILLLDFKTKIINIIQNGNDEEEIIRKQVVSKRQVKDFFKLSVKDKDMEYFNQHLKL